MCWKILISLKNECSFSVAVGKEASNVQLFRYEGMVLTRYEGKLRIVSL